MIVSFWWSFLWSNLSRNQPNTYSVCTQHAVLTESLKSGRKGDSTLTAAWEISNSIAFSSVSVDWLTCLYAFSQTFVDAEYRSGRWGGDEGRRTGAEKSKHCSRWQNTDHPGDPDLPCSLFLHHSLWPLAPQPKAMLSPAVFYPMYLCRVSVCWSTRACEHHDWH